MDCLPAKTRRAVADHKDKGLSAPRYVFSAGPDVSLDFFLKKIILKVLYKTHKLTFFKEYISNE